MREVCYFYSIQRSLLSDQENKISIEPIFRRHRDPPGFFLQKRFRGSTSHCYTSRRGNHFKLV